MPRNAAESLPRMLADSAQRVLLVSLLCASLWALFALFLRAEESRRRADSIQGTEILLKDLVRTTTDAHAPESAQGD